MNITKINLKQDALPQLLHDSFQKCGFAIINNHGIDYELIKNVYKEWIDFFALPIEEKKSFLFQKDFIKVQDGYFPPDISETAKGCKVKDLKEFFHYSPGGEKLPSNIKHTVRLYKCLMNVALELITALNNAMHQESCLAEKISLNNIVDDTFGSIMRIIHYPPIAKDNNQDAIRAAAHTDINLITLLVAATEPGLCIQDKEGDWHLVECNAGDIIVNCGDMLQELTNGFYQSTAHRVMNPDFGKKNLSRYSIPLFLHPHPDTVLSDRYTAKTFLHERLSENGLI